MRSRSALLKAWRQNCMQTGGATITPDGRLLQEATGFMVSLPGHERTFRSLEQALEQAAQALEQAAALRANVGLWQDQASGTWYLDLSAVIHDRQEAEAAGRAAGQIAIWDLAAGKEVRL